MDSQPAPAQDLTPEELLAGSVDASGATKTVREFLDDYFTGSDLVTITNPMSYDTGWVFADPKSERVEQPDKNTRRVYHAERQAKVLKPGQSITIPGWQAYIALDRMWKDYAQREHAGSVGITLSSPVEMAAFIDKAYLGIFDPNEQRPVKKPVTTALAAQSADIDPLVAATSDSADDDLGFGDNTAPVTTPTTLPINNAA